MRFAPNERAASRVELRSRIIGRFILEPCLGKFGGMRKNNLKFYFLGHRDSFGLFLNKNNSDWWLVQPIVKLSKLIG